MGLWAVTKRYTDAQMIQSLGLENSTHEEMNVANQVDQVKLAKEWLEKQPRDCVVLARSDSGGARKYEKQAIEKHIHGSAECISVFLGVKNWSSTKVKDLLQLGNPDKVSPVVLSKLTNDPAKGGALAHGSLFFCLT
jgi:hypothetical protein